MNVSAKLEEFLSHKYSRHIGTLQKTRNELRSEHCFNRGLSKRRDGRAFFVFLRSSLRYINVKKTNILHIKGPLKVPKMVLTKWGINSYSCQDRYMK